MHVLDKMSLRLKLYAVFGVLIAIFFATSLFAAYSLSSINEGALRISTEHLHGVTAASESSQTMAEYRQGEYAIVTATTLPNRIYAIQNAKKLRDQLNITFDAIEQDLTSGPAKDNFHEMRNIWEEYEKQSELMIEAAQNDKNQEALDMLFASSDAYQQITAKLVKVVEDRKDFIHMENELAASHYNNTMNTMIGSSVLVLAIALFMAAYMGRTVQESVDYLMMVSDEVSKGNLAIDIVPKTQDEFGKLEAAYRDTVVNLRSLIAKIKSTSESVSNFAEQLTENATQSAQATQQVANSISNVANSASQQVIEVNTSVTEISSMSKSLRSFEDKASSSTAAARSVEQLARDGRASIAGARKQMEEIATTVTDSGDVIRKLADRSEEIGQISNTIAGIAEETNLLALNAAIEAARAGEAGRGFAVVSEEVRKLAEESATASQQIAELIKHIQQETEMAVARMEQGTVTVRNGQVVMDQAGKSFDNIANAVSDLTAHAEDIQKEAKQCSARSQHLVDMMKDLNEKSQDVSAETESVSAATEEQSASMDEIANASAKLAGLSSDLQEATSKFKL